MSGKIPGAVASLQNPALDRILDLAGEAGLVVILHNDIDVPIAKDVAKDEPQPAYLQQIKVQEASPYHDHLGPPGIRAFSRTARGHLAQIEAILRDADFPDIYCDISWDEVAKYFVASPEATRRLADLMQRYPDRFLFGTDAAAPADQSKYLQVFHQYHPLWNSLDAETSRKVRLQNYKRIFDEARRRVRSWERVHVPGANANGMVKVEEPR